MSQTIKAIRECIDSETFDLKGLNKETAHNVIEEAFKDAFKLDHMVKITLVVGAGKLDRSKYDDDLPKWVSQSLKDVGYEEDRGADISLQSAGSFKFQHDTGKNMKYIHVFPRIEEPDDNAKGENDGEEVNDAKEGPVMTPQWLCVASKMDTFKEMVEVKMPAWIEKRRCSDFLKGEMQTLQEASDKLIQRNELTEHEQSLIDEVHESSLQEKVTFLTDEMKKMVYEGNLTEAEKALLLEQVGEKISIATSQIEEGGSNKDKLEAAKHALEERKQKLEAIAPIKHNLSNWKEIRSVLREQQPLEKLSMKAGPKGAWSAKLTPAEASKLSEKEEMDERLNGLLSAARHWFEEMDEFDLRVADAKKTIMSAPAGAKKKPAATSSDGWATVAKTKKKTNRAASGKVAGAKRSTNAFAALAD